MSLPRANCNAGKSYKINVHRARIDQPTAHMERIRCRNSRNAGNEDYRVVASVGITTRRIGPEATPVSKRIGPIRLHREGNGAYKGVRSREQREPAGCAKGAPARVSLELLARKTSKSLVGRVNRVAGLACPESNVTATVYRTVHASARLSR